MFLPLNKYNIFLFFTPSRHMNMCLFVCVGENQLEILISLANEIV